MKVGRKAREEETWNGEIVKEDSLILSSSDLVRFRICNVKVLLLI